MEDLQCNRYSEYNHPVATGQESRNSYTLALPGGRAGDSFAGKSDRMNRMTGIVVLAVVTGIISCKKPVDFRTSKLVIDLQQSAITVNQVDSANVVFRKIGTDLRVRQRLVKTAQNKLMIALHQLSPGTWHADIEVYTKAVNRQSNQYVIITPIQITGELADVRLTGPGATSGGGWVKRHVRASAGNEVVLIVPDDVYDAYFEFRSATARKLVLGIQREAINVNYVVDHKTWACTNACFDGEGCIADNNYFLPFVTNTRAHPWTSNSISIGVFTEKSEELVSYDRTYHP